MGAGNFFAGLLGGYTGTVLKNEERAYQQHIAAREYDMKLALQGVQDAVNADDPKMKGAAFANLQRATEALQQPFQYHQGGSKKGAKGKQQTQAGGIGIVPQIAIAGMAQQAQQKQAQATMSEATPPGVPSAAGLATSTPATTGPVPQRSQAAPGPSGMPATGPAQPPGSISTPQVAPQLPQVPQRPSTLADVYAAQPSLEAQATRSGLLKSTEINSMTEGLVKFQRSQGLEVTPEDTRSIQEHLAGIVPKLNSLGRVITGGYVDGADLPADATDPQGKPIGEDGRKKGQPYGIWLAPDGSQHYFPAKPPSSGAGTLSGFKLDTVKDLLTKTNPKTGKPYTQLEALDEVLSRSKSSSLAQQEADAWLAAHPGKTLADFLYWLKTVGSQSGVQLTPEAQEMAAQMWLQTGQTPTLGWGKAGSEQKIRVINRAAKMGQGTNVAENRAVYDSLKASLTKTQVQARMLNAFENVANKNLDLLLDTSKNLVDTGSPWINSTVRYLGQHGTGSTAVTKFITARQVAINEVSRVLNNMGSAGVLSDAARGEVSVLLSPDSTIAQINAAAKVLKQDMKNRHEGFPAEIKAIQDNIRNIGRISGASETTNQPPASTTGETISWKDLK